jgi:diguanylate cyclase (GGDEF)-like protein/putative nucleotidyltransferase with HDIG domain
MSHEPAQTNGAGQPGTDHVCWAEEPFEPLSRGLQFYGTACVLLAALVATAVIFIEHASGYWLSLIVAAPLYLAYRTQALSVARMDTGRRHFERLAELHLSTIEALALAIDAKDQTTTSHIRRVQHYAAAVAQRFGMSPAEVQGVRTAALLHDIGKLAVPEHILSKPGPLTQEEFSKVKIHPQIGAEIIGSVPFPYPVAPLILAHHERWDGRGYPRGLKGEEIPLGARILTVVDYFDAVTSERPYHAPITDQEAIEMITAEAGAALDPSVVRVFITMLPELRTQPAGKRDLTRHFSFAGVTRQRNARTGRDDGSGRTTVFQEIAQAHREIYALYEIAQSMGTGLGVGDTMALIASKLRNVVPFSTCALFLYDANTEAFACQFATGVDADPLRKLVIRQGQGVIGWVGANRRALLNARPAADFEAAGFDPDTSLTSALVCPLATSDQLVGALAVYQVDALAFTEDHRRLLDRVSEQAAGVVANALVFEQTRHDSLTDPLTGLPNARFMFAHLARELARAARLGSQVSVLVMDLDDFKPINDHFGHPVGDRALREVARAMRSAIRPYDSCVRYAGDEFVIVLSGCGPAEARTKRIELQQALDDLRFEARPGHVVTLSGSFGIASYPEDGDTYEVLLATADRRMYQDKSGARDDVDVSGARPAGASRFVKPLSAKVASTTLGAGDLHRHLGPS